MADTRTIYSLQTCFSIVASSKTIFDSSKPINFYHANLQMSVHFILYYLASIYSTKPFYTLWRVNKCCICYTICAISLLQPQLKLQKICQFTSILFIILAFLCNFCDFFESVLYFHIFQLISNNFQYPTQSKLTNSDFVILCYNYYQT